MRVDQLLENPDWENESTDWDNNPHPTKKHEIAALEKKRKAITHERQLVFDRLPKLQAQGIVWTNIQGSPNGIPDVRIPSTGGLETAYVTYWCAPNDPTIVKWEAELKKLTNQDKIYDQLIKDLTIKNHTFVFTGFRDSGMEAAIERGGGRVTTSISAKTDFVVAADPSDVTGKIQKAKELGISIMSKQRMNQILRNT